MPAGYWENIKHAGFEAVISPNWIVEVPGPTTFRGTVGAVVVPTEIACMKVEVAVNVAGALNVDDV